MVTDKYRRTVDCKARLPLSARAKCTTDNRIAEPGPTTSAVSGDVRPPSAVVGPSVPSPPMSSEDDKAVREEVHVVNSIAALLEHRSKDQIYVLTSRE